MPGQVQPTVVPVTFHGPGIPLTIDPQKLHVDLEAGGLIQWQFVAAPGETLENLLVHIQFESSFGPFQGLTSSGTSVSGKGNTGVAGEHRYTAMVLCTSGWVATSGTTEAVVDNLSEARDTSPHAVVIYDPVGKALGVTPGTLGVQFDQTATWHIEGVPADHFVTFQFPNFSDQLAGPFSVFSLERNVIPGSPVLLASGELYQPGNAQSPITYLIQVRDASGTVIASDDPLIATLGDPPPSPEGA